MGSSTLNRVEVVVNETMMLDDSTQHRVEIRIRIELKITKINKCSRKMRKKNKMNDKRWGTFDKVRWKRRFNKTWLRGDWLSLKRTFFEKYKTMFLIEFDDIVAFDSQRKIALTINAFSSFTFHRSIDDFNGRTNRKDRTRDRKRKFNVPKTLIIQALRMSSQP